ncbi:MAG TPA: type VI secretion system baseplate subunit TssF [Verrucomicrobiae bacterium]|jgi:type VI secretion system protein ImpG|nr:type VI secretion system baseplate subunit TssF [Verrucomicrobiae bacterium]
MDERLLEHYNTELRHLREMAGEFANEFPKIAGRLALDKDAKEICPDPYVERLLEGFAYLAARVHLKLDAEFPRFSQSLLETIYPHYLSPIPSMSVVRFEPSSDPALATGVPIPRGTLLRSNLGKGERTACTFQTAHAVRLLPLRIAEVRYFTRDVAELELPAELKAKAAIRLRLALTVPVPFKELANVPLTVFLRGADELPAMIYEQILAHKAGLVVQSPAERGKSLVVLPPENVRRVGFSESEALLPASPRSFEGYRLLREYFAFSQRFLFLGFEGFGGVMGEITGNQIDLIVPLREADTRLENRVTSSSFELFCTPIINLFPKQLDRIEISDKFSEFHVVPDHNRPLDFEVFEIQSVTGYGAETGQEQEFRPFYLARDTDTERAAFYTLNRVPRMLTAKEKQFGGRSTYAGTEVYLSLVDAASAPYRTDLRQLGIRALCTNRHLPIQMATGLGSTDFTMEINAPVASIRCLSSPTVPRPSWAEGRFTWRLISHLSLNYFSLIESKSGDGVAALREMLRLYADANDRQTQRQIEGLVKVQSKPIVRRVPGAGSIAFARGVEITLTFDEIAFEGTGAFLLGAVMEQFFAKYVTLNSFTETVVRTQQRGEIMRWPTQIGKRQII